MLKIIKGKVLLIGVPFALLITSIVDIGAKYLKGDPETWEIVQKAEPLYLVLSGYFMKYNIMRIVVCGAIPGFVVARYSKTNKIANAFLVALISQLIYIYFHDFNFIRKHEMSLALPILLILFSAVIGGLIGKHIRIKHAI